MDETQVPEVEGRIPPHDVDAEAACLSAVLVDATGLDNVADVLRVEQFYSEAHARIYESVLRVHERGVVPDVITVGADLRDHERLAQVGGMPYLTDVLNAAPALRARTYAEIVRDKWVAREVLKACIQGRAEGYSDYGTAQDYANRMGQRLYEIAAGNTAASMHPVLESLRSYMRKLADAANRGTHITGLSTGFERYDRVTSGLHNDELTIIAARPGMGKTALALDIAQNVCANPDDAVVVFQLEMPHEQLTMRMLCSRARVDVGRVRSGMLSPTDWSKITPAASDLAKCELFIDDKPDAAVIDVRTKARRVASEVAKRGKKLRLIVVDYLQLMRGTGNEDNREQQVAGIARGLKLVARELQLPVIALAQLNRACEERKDKRPVLSDLRESGAIEQDADNVVFVYRDDYYNKQSPDRNVAELIIAKQRNGAQDTVKVRFDPQYTRFDSLAEGEFDEEGRYGD